eukprot:jgi/Tetstr1/464482/TSEL_009240.t1
MIKVTEFLRDMRKYSRSERAIPFNNSIKAIVDKVVKALEEEHGDVGDLEEAGISVPSHAWVELQFCPKNIMATTALAFTCHVHLTMKDAILEPSSPLRWGPCRCNFALLALFLEAGMDTMLVAKTAPQHSWANPS